MMQTYRALIAAGVPENKAVLAAINPEAAKSILPTQFGNDNYSVVQTGENQGNRILVWICFGVRDRQRIVVDSSKPLQA